MGKWNDVEMNSYYEKIPESIFPFSPFYKVIHIHIPKTAGTSVRNALFNSTFIKHVPAASVEKNLWESMPSFSIVRHPMSRLISNYKYHCKSSYGGVLMKSNPDLKDLTMEEYCDRLLGKSVLLAPQSSYVCRSDTRKKQIDHIIKFENMLIDLPELFDRLGIEAELENLKQSPAVVPEVSDTVRAKICDFYADDYAMFGYE